MRTIAWLVSILFIYKISCILPALGPRETPGIVCLISIPFVLFHPAWWANPLFFAGCVAPARGNDRLAARLGFAALMLAVGFDTLCQFDEFLIGSYFWMASMAGLTAAGLMAPHEADY